MRKLIVCAAAAGITLSMAVPAAAQTAAGVYRIGGYGCQGLSAWDVLCRSGCWDQQDCPSGQDEPEWFPGQGGSAGWSQQDRPDVQDEPEWFPGQGGNAGWGQQSRPDVQDEPEWFPGQGGNAGWNQQDRPDAQKPDVQVPDIQQPDVQQPDVQWPDIQWPDTQWPDIQWPDAQKPDTQKPDAQKPDTQKPDTQVPDTQKPDMQRPSQSGSQARSYINGVIELVNRERAAAGLNPVTEDYEVTEAAGIRAQEIVRSFSHTRPNGSHFSTVLSQNGISFFGAGENIAYGFSTPEAVMNSWMNSASHRANILNGQYTHIGVGYYQSGGTIYCTQLFTY